MANFDRERRRKFGQNFLNNPSLVRGIASDLPALAGDQLVEIGPGHGALTRELLGRGFNIAAYDIDLECVDLLREQFAQFPLQVHHQNFMDVDMSVFSNPRTWFVGNLPYNVGTAIVTKVMAALPHFAGAMFMLQLEVIERMCAQPGTKDYNSLSVYCQSHAHLKLLRKVGPENFSPKPNVMSATALFLAKDPSEIPPPAFFEFAQSCFRLKRKTLQNNLSETYTKPKIAEALEKCGLSLASRAEEMEIPFLMQLWNILEGN